MLTQLTISFSTFQEVNISIFAPMVEKVSWHCSFAQGYSAFGLWQLGQLSLQAAERQGQPPSLHIHICKRLSFYPHDEVGSFTQEIEKQLIAAFSVLELHLETKGHVYGAVVSHVLETNQIRCAIQKLKVDIKRSVMEEEEEGCLLDCSCEPTDWKS